jgi:tRNA pseudouridine55 synthase
MTMDAPRTRVVRRPVHGVLLIDKPLGMTSNQALQKAKWLLRAEKAGHTGTLDPLASGVLPLCFGAATKFSQLQLEADKTYEAVALLGVTTTTGDAEGEVLERRTVDPAQITPERLEQVRLQFTGPIRQVPPMHSALKKDGKALYEYARAGIAVERAPRDVTIHALNLALTQDSKAQAAIKMIVKCSKGTYIRTLGEDIGAALGCGAHLAFAAPHRDRPIRRGALHHAGATGSDGRQAQRERCLEPVEALLDDRTCALTLEAATCAPVSLRHAPPRALA